MKQKLGLYRCVNRRCSRGRLGTEWEAMLPSESRKLFGTYVRCPDCRDVPALVNVVERETVA